MQYVVITSDVPENTVKSLRKKGMTLKVYAFNPVLDLSSVPFDKRKNGGLFGCWRQCANFIEGLAWEDYGIKPKTKQQAQEGNLSPHMSCNRGWGKWRCKAYEGKERFLKQGDRGERVTDNNPKGIVSGSSWITCDHCEYYSPKTLEGQMHVLTAIKGQYQAVLAGIDQRLSQLGEELKRQTPETQK